MHRRSFLALLAAAAAAPRPARAEGLHAAVGRAVRQIPGITGVYARTMSGAPALVAINDEVSFPAASTIKMLIMLTAFNAGALHETVVVHASDIVGGSPFLAGATGGERFTVAQLVKPMIQLSDNTASNALISHFGFERINAQIHEAGLYRTQLKRHFLDYSAIVHHMENRTTPRDMGVLFYELERSSREDLTTVATAANSRAMIEILLGQTDRDKIPAGLPSGVSVANKTGEVDGVRNDAAIVDPFGDSPFVLTVYTKDVDDYAAALAGINRIAGAVYARVAGSDL